MSNDLISRSALLEEMKNISPNAYTTGQMMYLAENAPTAYDLDKVVEQLEEFRQEMEQFGCGCILSDIIEVVNGGGTPA